MNAKNHLERILYIDTAIRNKVFPASIAYTGSFRTPIPEIKGQLFRSKKDTCSGNKRTLLAGAPE